MVEREDEEHGATRANWHVFMQECDKLRKDFRIDTAPVIME